MSRLNYEDLTSEATHSTEDVAGPMSVELQRTAETAQNHRFIEPSPP